MKKTNLILFIIILSVILANTSYASSKSISVEVSATIVSDFNVSAQQTYSPAGFTITGKSEKSIPADNILIQIQTASNIGKPYQVLQSIKNTKPITDQAPIVMVSGTKDNSEVIIPRPKPMTVRPALVCVSNSNGEPYTLNMQYQLNDNDSGQTIVYTMCSI